MKWKKKSLIAVMILCMMLFLNAVVPVVAANDVMETKESVMRAVPGFYKCIGNAVNIRTGPGTNYEIVGTLDKGDVVYVLSISLGWAQFNKDGYLRYVKADYLQETRT